MPGARPLVLVAALLAGALSPPAEALDPGRAITQYHLDSWRRGQGLPSNGVLAITQTRDGYIWIGTYAGLVRFDGVRFTVYDRGNTPALGNSSAWRLLETSDGTLWVGTNGGGLASYRRGIFRSFTTKDGLSADVITGLGEAAPGTVWVGTRNGLDRVRPTAAGIEVLKIPADDGRPLTAPYAIAGGTAGSLFVGTTEALYELDPSLAAPRARRRATVGAPVWALLLDRSGTLWAGTGAGLLEVRAGGERRHSTAAGLPVDVVSALEEDAQGNLWIGTDGGGLVRYRDGRFETLGEAQGLTSSRIAVLATDREGSLWIGTSRAGLNRLRDGKLVPLTAAEGIPDDLVWHIVEDRDGSLLLCTANGLGRLRGGRITDTFVPSPTDHLVRAALRDRQGRLWVATRSEGIVRLAETPGFSRQASFGTAEGLPSNHVRAMAEDRQGRLWLGTPLGLCVKEGETIRRLGPADSVPAVQVLALLVGRDGAVWIATDGAGLVRETGGRFTAFTETDGLPSDVVLGLFEDERGVLWVATNGGLARFDGTRFAAFGRAQGVASEMASQVLEDRLGGLWVGSNLGLCRLARSDLDAVAAGRMASAPSFSLGLSDGMRSDECNVPAVPARTRDGRLLFPTTRGIAVVDPAHIPRNPLPPPLVVEEVTASGRSQPASGDVVLEPSERSFEVHYAALSLLAPEKVRFRYRLVGFESGWIDAGTRRTAYYTAVPPGRYRFQVLACNDDGVWAETPAEVLLTVRPTLWQTWWAQLLGLALAVGVVAGAVRVRLRLLERRTEALEAEVALRTRDLVESNALLQHERAALEAANTRLQELDRIKADFTAMLVHDLKAPLTVVTATLKLLRSGAEGDSEQRDKLLAASERSSDRMLGLINETLEVFRSDAEEIQLAQERIDPGPLLREAAQSARITAVEKGIALTTAIESPLPPIDADPDRLTRVLENLLSNAVKFTRTGGTIRLEARSVAGTGVEAGLTLLLVSVTDTGEGIPPEDVPYVFNPYHQGSARRKSGVGLGLAIVKRIVAAHGGNITVRSQLGVGSCFTVVLPAARDEARTAS